jgi:hypothetical protein
MRTMREDFERVKHGLSTRNVSENPTFDAIAIEVNHRIPTPKDTFPDPMVNDSIIRSAASELVSDTGPFNPEFAFDVSRASLPANGLNSVGSDVNGLIRTSLSGLLQHLQLLVFRSELVIEK